jgi:hypothetical protein
MEDAGFMAEAKGVKSLTALVHHEGATIASGIYRWKSRFVI